VGVVVDDLQRMAAFYEALGVPRTQGDAESVQLDLDGRTFEILQRSDEPQYDRRRFQVGFDVADIEATRAALIAAGAEPISDILGGDNRWAYFRDPEGNVFEITQRQARPVEPG
jgi:catechol 2,3-dioxygenase-like lactoylglutathione lyase family enzyme